jgi:predicted permease
MRPWGVKRLFRFSSRTPDDVRKDIAAELDFHREMRTEALMREGMTHADARARALGELGDAVSRTPRMAADGRRVERWRWMRQAAGEFRQDSAHGLRLLRRNPGFAAVAILTLALGIGANTAIYSVVDTVLWRPLPYPEPDRLVQVSETHQPGRPNAVSGGAFLDWRGHDTGFEALALTGRITRNLRGPEGAERLRGLEVSHEFLRVLGIQPLLGRGFLPGEDQPGGASRVVLLTEHLWQARFGGRDAIVGQTIVLDEVPHTVVGVLPRDAWILKDDTFFVPAVLEPGTPRAARAPHWAAVFGRLAPGISPADAEVELRTIKRHLNAEYPAFKQEWSVMVQPAMEVLGEVTRAPLLVLVGAVLLVLLIACANVANLLLARGAHRQQELAVRGALGAGSGRLLRQALAEHVTLAALGGAAGLLAASVGMGVLRRVTVGVMPFTFSPDLDLRVLSFSLALTLGTALLFGTLPALRARTPDLKATLNNGGRSATAGGRRRTQALLVAGQVALTAVLLVSAGLLLRSLANAATADPGFDPARVLAFDVSLPDATYDSHEKRLAYSSALLERLRALPGVEAAGGGMAIPFAGGGFGEFFSRPDRPDAADRLLGRVDFVSPGYLEAIGTNLIRGRRLTDADNQGEGQRVVVVNETVSRSLFPERGPLGETLLIAGQPWTIVGVIADVVDRQLDAPHRPFAYVPQVFDSSALSIVLRTPMNPEGLVQPARREVERLDPGVALANPRVLEQAMTRSMTERKVLLGLVAAFAVTALGLASVGLYGVMMFAVATRRREFGIRLALGAVRRDVIGDVLSGGLRVVGLGLLAGLAAALAAGRLLGSQLYEVGGTDPLVIAGTTGVLAAIALLACWIPARSAARVDPITVLREE